MNVFIDIHALHTLPPSNINRDDTGAPKSATFGGVPRQTVSSQAWKRAIRRQMSQHPEKIYQSCRTLRLIECIVKEVLKQDPQFDENTAIASAESLCTAAGLKIAAPKKKKDEAEEESRYPKVAALAYLSQQQIEKAAEEIIASGGEKFSKAEAKQILTEHHSVDMAMFGRMLAGEKYFNVDASVQVAHAIGVSAAEPEFDYFTAVDDFDEIQMETGAGMIGTTQMMSSTLYRYATIDMESLAKNLGDSAVAVEAAKEFVRAFALSMPTGKQNSFANRTLPEVLVVQVRRDRPVSWVGAFETPIESQGTGTRKLAAEALAGEAKAFDDMYGMPAENSWVCAHADLAEAFTGLAERASLPELLQAVSEVHLAGSAQE